MGARPKEKDGPFYEHRAGIDAYCFKFPGADASVVRLTQNSLAGRGEVRCNDAVILIGPRAVGRGVYSNVEYVLRGMKPLIC